MEFTLVEAATDKALKRMDVSKIDLMQFHWWDYSDDEYITALKHFVTLQKQGKIRLLGLTNFDTIRLEKIVDDNKIAIVSNQVQFSLLDRRPLNKMVPFCKKHDIKLLCYGVVAGGLISDKYLGKPNPTKAELDTASLQKYYRVLKQCGGWTLFQQLLSELKKVSDKHKVSIVNVAQRWVLQQPQVGGIIIGTRLGLAQHIDENLNIFAFQLDEEDLTAIDSVLRMSSPLPGDCGDEYRG